MWNRPNKLRTSCVGIAVILVVAVGVTVAGVFARAAHVACASACWSDLSDFRTVLNHYVDEHDGNYPTRAEFVKLVRKELHRRLDYGGRTFRYHRPPRNADGSFAVIRCVARTGFWPFYRRSVVDLRRDGTIYSHGSPCP